MSFPAGSIPFKKHKSNPNEPIYITKSHMRMFTPLINQMCQNTQDEVSEEAPV